MSSEGGSGHFRASQEHKLWSCMTVSQGWAFATCNPQEDTQQKPALLMSLESMNEFMFLLAFFKRGSLKVIGKFRSSHAPKVFFPHSISDVGLIQPPIYEKCSPQKSAALLSALRLLTVTFPCRKLQNHSWWQL